MVEFAEDICKAPGDRQGAAKYEELTIAEATSFVMASSEKIHAVPGHHAIHLRARGVLRALGEAKMPVWLLQLSVWTVTILVIAAMILMLAMLVA